MNTVRRIAASPAATRLGGLTSKLFTPPADAIDLPTYPTLPSASPARTGGQR
jgi:hypothetical protein